MAPRVWLCFVLIAAFLIGTWLPNATTVAADRPPVIEFNRDIRPILSNHCYACHGPDKNKRKADLRLDIEDGPFGGNGGEPVIVRGKPGESELYRRLTAQEESERMPPAKSGKALSQKQIGLIKKWIEQGAAWQKHWSLIVPTRPDLPALKNAARVRHAIDRFILARLEQEGLKPSREADRRTLIRRLSFDLLGLPPTPEEVDAFVADASPQAYERLVDRLISSPHYGERMAMYWLDLVRYADSIGYHSDNSRNVSPYRDYVIQAFNESKPFDKFTTEQIAGDLLPDSSVWQKVASGYNRLLMTTEEGGAQAKEYLAKYQADHVRNVSSAWLGMTMGCAECHDHKFDPFPTKDFYRLAAFFADVQETPVGRREPGMLVTTPQQAAELSRLEDTSAEAKKTLLTPNPQLGSLGLRLYTPMPVINPAVADFIREERKKEALLKTIPRSLVSVATTPRETRILPRGNWLDESGEIVQPGLPASLSTSPPQGERRVEGRATRLDLAQWLVSRDNPVTARVFVNRLWKLFFGQGISRSLEDFGSQGEWPTHPELLDWLAVEFIESGWNVKHMVKLMVMCSTYRQTSHVSKELRERDADNRLLARQSRFRLDAEMVRDNALAVSGLLVRKIGGESVKPYQPAGYWDFMNFPKRTYQNDRGDSQYRRGLYTHWQRTFLHPSMLAFDASTREECAAERPRSNIPQQALVLLNDLTYVEAARVFATRIMKDGGSNTGARLQWAYRRALSREINQEELAVLSELLEKHRTNYREDQTSAEQLVQTGQAQAPQDVEVPELAAWTSVARTILNLHETITRE